MTSNAPAERPSWHLGHLDALRGLAVMGVLMVHCVQGCPVSPAWAEFARNGQRGVQLFFLVSAFTLFLSNDQRRRAELHPTRNFFIRRVFRLTPMYYAAILLSVWLHPEVIGGWRDLLLGVFYLQWVTPDAIAHVTPGGWTLSVEAMFYLCLPLLFRYVRSLRQALWTFTIAAAVLAGISRFLAHTHPVEYPYFSFLWFPVELPVFLLGIVVYFLWKERLSNGLPAFQNKKKWVAALLYAGFVIVLAISLPQTNRKLYLSSGAYALLLTAVLLHAWPPLVNRVTIYLGKISYSIYLLHASFFFPVQHFAAEFPYLASHPALRFGFQFTGTLALTAAMASFTWLYLEESGIRLGRRLISHLEHRAATRPGTAIPIPAGALLEETNSPDAQF